MKRDTAPVADRELQGELPLLVREKPRQKGSTPVATSELQAPISVRIPEAIRLTGIRRSKLYELIKARQIEVAKSGTSTLVIFESLRRHVYGQRR